MCKDSIVRAHEEFFVHNGSNNMNHLMVWCAYKGVMHGTLIKHSAMLRKKRNAQIDVLLFSIHSKETLNKTSPSFTLSSSLKADRMSLHNLLTREYENNLHHMKTSHYHSINKAGKLLVLQLKSQRLKRKITRILHPRSNVVKENSVNIADAFAINSFLRHVNLPQVSDHQLKSISCPFTTTKILSTISHLPFQRNPGIDGFNNGFYK